jgi:hypothetical protein
VGCDGPRIRLQARRVARHRSLEPARAALAGALCDDLSVARVNASLIAAVGSPLRSPKCLNYELASLVAMDSVRSVLGRNNRVASLANAQDPEFVATIE